MLLVKVEYAEYNIFVSPMRGDQDSTMEIDMNILLQSEFAVHKYVNKISGSNNHNFHKTARNVGYMKSQKDFS